MSWAENVRIETPEQIDVDLEIAGPGSRFFAQLIDWLVKGGVLALALLGFLAIGGVLGYGGAGTAAWFVVAAGVAFAFVFMFGYDVYFEGARNGQTPGKKLAGVRVVRDGGGPIDVSAALIRNLIGIADFLPAYYLLGGLIMLMNTKGQRLGDMAAGTIVIRERPMELHQALEENILAAAGPDFVFSPEQLARCAPNAKHILHSFFARCDDLNRSARRDLGAKLRDTFLDCTGYQPTVPIDSGRAAEAFLAALYRDLKTLRQNA